LAVETSRGIFPGNDAEASLEGIYYDLASLGVAT
jgi:hypothetical protein